MKTLILHIGTMKTGTTSIQNTLSCSSDYLYGKGICYPKELHHNNLTFYPLFIPNPNIFDLWIEKHGCENTEEIKNKYLSMWRESFLKENCNQHIISSELLCYYSQGAVRNLYDFVRPYFSQIKIVLYVREPNRLIVSQVQQAAKNARNKMSLSKSLNHFKKKYSFQFLKFWENVFGKENIVVCPFDPTVFKNGNLIDDFFFNCEINNIDMDLLTVNRANDSLGSNSVRFLYEYKQRYPRILNHQINSARGGVRFHNLYNLYRLAENDKFHITVSYSQKNASRINQEIDFINSFFKNSTYRIHKVKHAKPDHIFNNFSNIDAAFYGQLVDEYNKFIDSLLSKRQHKIHNNSDDHNIPIKRYGNNKQRMVVLHIGTPNDGSFSLQRFLWNHTEIFAELGIHFSCDNDNQSTDFSPLFLGQTNDKNIFANSGAIHNESSNCGLLEEWSNLFTRSNSYCHIISSDKFMLFDKTDIMKMKTFLSRYFNHFKIIAYIHPPQCYVPNLIVHHARNSHRSVISKQQLNLNSAPNYANLRTWRSLFNPEDIIIRPTCSESLVDHDITNDFLNQLGCNSIERSYILHHPSAQNDNAHDRHKPLNIKATTDKTDYPTDIFRHVNPSRINLNIKYGLKEAYFLNKLIKELNLSIPNPNDHFPLISTSLAKTLSRNVSLNIDFFVELINQYNKYIDQLRAD